MIGDAWTIVRKEWKELLLVRGGSRGGLMGMLIYIGVLGIFLPLQMGRTWVEPLMTLAYSGWVPLFLVISVVADSFAGERDRRTLETLLASRLSDRAILFGKICAALSYGLGFTLASLCLGLVTVNLAYGHGELLLFSVPTTLGILGFSFLGAGLASGLGILISLRAATVRQAQQTLSIAVMLLLFIPVFGVQALPDELKPRLAKALMAAGVTNIALAAVAVLTVLDIGLLVAAMARFQRARLILD